MPFCTNLNPKATIYASNHFKNVFTNGTLARGSVENVLSHHISTDVEEYAAECYIEHKFIGFLNFLEMTRHLNFFNFLTRLRYNNRISRYISRSRRGSFFHPIQVRNLIYKRNIHFGRISINNDFITRVIWSNGGPRTIVIRRKLEKRKFIIPTGSNFGRYLNLLYEYEFDVEDNDDYIETIRRVTSTNYIFMNENIINNFENLNIIYNNDLSNQNSG
ncbi:Hypothetical protein SRAE_X000095100 [Strongyloides ratti]|uniref:Uncharacterized protein n=1 Tax=Strongyloides ratti TaxID=34506 RepID=A0A090N111_STRRB|nr:Hypothetical protein SRAE_X000095100 [Strongyloides ratti]CEF71628.1 Hypothetical protein SRAE_X000095100 [Strongyloides ratti]